MSNQDIDNNEEKAFYKALKYYGIIFPETEEEITRFSERISQMTFKIPKKLDDPLAILEEGKVEKVGKFNSFNDEYVDDNLAQAARDGSEITEDIWEKMKKDRKDAEGSEYN